MIRQLGDIIEILRAKTGISAERLMEMIKQKQEGVGGGYLSEVGAAYLVAADLGVHLAAEPVLTLSVSDLTPGLKGVTIFGRILTIGQLKERKLSDDNSRKLHYRKLVIYDQKAMALVLLWREAAKKIESIDLFRGDAIKIGKVNVGASRDYHVTIHAYEDIILEKVHKTSIPDPRELVADIRNMSKEGRVLGLRGIILGIVRVGINDKGEAEFATFKLRDFDDSSKIMRATMRPIPIEPDILKAQIGKLAYLYNVRIARSSYGELFIRFDDESYIEFETVQVSHDIYVISARDDAKVGVSYILGIDEKGNYVFIEAPLSMTQPLGNLLDRVISITVRRISTHVNPQDIVELKVGSSKLPTASQPFTRIAEIKPDSQLIFLRAIVISRPVMRKMLSREGKEIELCRVLLGDETGEIELVAWGSQTHQLDGLLPGQRIFVRAVRPRVFNNNVRLELTKFSSISTNM